MTDMACDELVEVVTAYLEGTLPDAERRRVDAHLAECPYCTEYLAQIRATIARLGALEDPPLSAAARATLLDAFRDRRR